jgi:hypothetical protein
MYGPFAGQRAAALQIESRLVDRLLATGTPLVFTGDFNDRRASDCALGPRLISAFSSPGVAAASPEASRSITSLGTAPPSATARVIKRHARLASVITFCSSPQHASSASYMSPMGRNAIIRTRATLQVRQPSLSLT